MLVRVLVWGLESQNQAVHLNLKPDLLPPTPLEIQSVERPNDPFEYNNPNIWIVAAWSLKEGLRPRTRG